MSRVLLHMIYENPCVCCAYVSPCLCSQLSDKIDNLIESLCVGGCMCAYECVYMCILMWPVLFLAQNLCLHSQTNNCLLCILSLLKLVLML